MELSVEYIKGEPLLLNQKYSRCTLWVIKLFDSLSILHGDEIIGVGSLTGCFVCETNIPKWSLILVTNHTSHESFLARVTDSLGNGLKYFKNEGAPGDPNKLRQYLREPEDIFPHVIVEKRNDR